jgi:hypothetical protein
MNQLLLDHEELFGMTNQEQAEYLAWIEERHKDVVLQKQQKRLELEILRERQIEIQTEKELQKIRDEIKAKY